MRKYKLPSKKMIKSAEEQFVLFTSAKQDYDIIELIESMGLSKEEWKYMRKNDMVGVLNKQEISDIEKYFKKGG